MAFGDIRISHLPACSSPPLPRCLFLFLLRAFDPDCFQLAPITVADLSFSTVAVKAPVHLGSYDSFMPMPGTRAEASLF